MKTWKLAWDIESNNLLNNESIDYTAIPYKLKDSFAIHCIVVIVQVAGKEYTYGFHDGEKYLFDGREYRESVEGVEYVLKEGYAPLDYIHRPLDEFVKFVQAVPEGSTIIAHNMINFDLLATKLYWGLDYTVENNVEVGSKLGDDSWAGKSVVFDDTLVRSKTLNPDRFGGHSLDALSQQGDTQKIEFRKHLPKEKRFTHFAADMLYYNIFDVKANLAVADMLDKEQEEYNWGQKWEPAIKLEKAVAELITRQEHRGFWFDMELAQKNLDELDAMMAERKEKIEAVLPPRPATKAFMKTYTPSKIQFKKDGTPSANMIKFVEKIGSSLYTNEALVQLAKERYEKGEFVGMGVDDL